MEKWREYYALIINKYMEKYGHDKQLTHISYERQGIDKIATVRLSRIDYEREKRGEKTRRGNLNRKIREENQQREALKQEQQQLHQEVQEKFNQQLAELEPSHNVEFEDRYNIQVTLTPEKIQEQTTPSHEVNFEDHYRRKWEILNPEFVELYLEQEH